MLHTYRMREDIKFDEVGQKYIVYGIDAIDADGTVLKITMVADRDLLVENHKGVIRYTDQLIRLHSDHGVVRIEGEGLQLSEFAMERAYIRGSVFGWQIEEKGFRDLS